MEQDRIIMAAGALLLVLIAVTGIAGLIRYLRRRRKEQDIDQMEGHDFEVFCAGLLEKHGFI